GAEAADPFEAGLADERLDELRQPLLDADILAVARRVLGHEAELLDALRFELLRLAHQRVDPAAAELAAHLRDRAERARIRATFADFEISVRAAVDEHARQIFVQPRRHLPLHRRGVDAAADGLRDRLEVIEADE